MFRFNLPENIRKPGFLIFSKRIKKEHREEISESCRKNSVLHYIIFWAKYIYLVIIYLLINRVFFHERALNSFDFTLIKILTSF